MAKNFKPKKTYRYSNDFKALDKKTMNSNNLLLTVARIGAIIVVVSMIERIPLDFGIFYLDGTFSWYHFTGVILLPNLIIFFIALLMWINPSLFIKNNAIEGNLNIENIDISELGSILIAIVGLYILTFSFADLICHITSIKMTKSVLGKTFQYTADQIGLLVATIVELIIGILLIFGRGLLYRTIRQFNREFKGGS